jgi:hypothetical protein
MAVFCSLITTGLAKNQYQFAAQNRPNINSHENEKLSKAQIYKKIVSVQQFRLLQNHLTTP